MTRALALAAGLWVGWRISAVRHDLHGKVVLISGGSRGLGLVLARLAAKRGARLVICARNADELDQARRELARETEVLARVCDVADPEAVQDLVQEAYARFGRVDVLVNNASVIQVGPEPDMSLGDYREAMDVNFWGAVHLTLGVLPGMRARGDGAIVNVTSIGAVVAVPHLLPYTAAKFAHAGFSLGLREEEARNGIRVTTIVPGLMRTGSFLHARVKGNRRAEAGAFTLSASLPLVTMSADRAARRIVRAIERGESYVVLGMPFKAARIAFALMPSVSTRIAAAVNRVLPKPAGTQHERHEPIWKHRPAIAKPPVTALGDRAARRNNETVALGDDPVPAP